MLLLFLTFLKIGLFTFGGGYAMITQIKEQIVEKKGWLSEDELTEIIAVAESTPGPIAINLATYVGYKRHGVLGSVFATLGVVLPSLVILFCLSLVLETVMENKYVAYAFTGIKCAVAFLILKAGIEMLVSMKKTPLSLAVFVLVLGAMVAFDLFAVHFSSLFFILLGGAIGVVAYAVQKAKNKNGEDGKQ